MAITTGRAEVEVGGHNYRIGVIDARSQFHIVRRLAPLLGELAPIAARAEMSAMEALPPLAAALAKLSDEDADYCIFGLLKAVQREQVGGLGWGPVCAGTAIAYQDITMPVMLQLAWHAASANLAGFFAALPSDLKGAIQKASDLSAG